MTPEELQGELQRRAPNQWELYRKVAETRELEAARAWRRRSSRREEGWAARWHEGRSLHFASASSVDGLARAIPEALRIPAPAEDPPDWPSHVAAEPSGSPAVEDAPDLFEELSRSVSAASRGGAGLSSLSLRRGRVEERIQNGAGLDVTFPLHLSNGVALTVARRGARAHESRMPFQWTDTADIEALARRIADAATLPLSDRSSPFPTGQWLLDPGVSAALLAALAPLFSSSRLPSWLARDRVASPALAIADDASGDAPFDGEGVRSRRVLLVEGGALTGRLEDLRSARRTGKSPTGHGVRASFRTAPRAGPRRISFQSSQALSAAELLGSVKRGLFAAALTAPIRMDLKADRYEAEFTGIAIVAGRAEGPVAGARATGRVSELLRRVSALGEDRQFFPLPFPAGSPTILVEHATFD